MRLKGLMTSAWILGSPSCGDDRLSPSGWAPGLKTKWIQQSAASSGGRIPILSPVLWTSENERFWPRGEMSG